MLKELPYAVFFDVCEPVLPDNKQTKKMTNMGLDSSQNEAFRLSFLEKEKKKVMYHTVRKWIAQWHIFFMSNNISYEKMD